MQNVGVGFGRCGSRAGLSGLLPSLVLPIPFDTLSSIFHRKGGGEPWLVANLEHELPKTLLDGSYRETWLSASYVRVVSPVQQEQTQFLQAINEVTQHRVRL